MGIGEYAAHLAAVITHIGKSDFETQLVSSLKELLPIDNAVILYYTPQHSPRLVYNDLPPANRPTHIELFLKGAYLLDPCYQAGLSGHKGFYRLQELAPSGFRSSEYFKNHFRHTGLLDECGYLLHLNGSLVNISLGRDETHSRFSSSQRQLLSNLASLIESLYLQHWQQSNHHPDNGKELQIQLFSALEHFGRSVLTEREAQIIQLFLHGHSTKSIAQKLGISPETVKLHRKHSYAKLDVASQAELFFLFIDALSSMVLPCDTDPLAGYLSREK